VDSLLPKEKAFVEKWLGHTEDFDGSGRTNVPNASAEKKREIVETVKTASGETLELTENERRMRSFAGL